MVDHNELITVEPEFFSSKLYQRCAQAYNMQDEKVQRLRMKFMDQYRLQNQAAAEGKNPEEWADAERQIWKIFWVNPMLAIRIVEGTSFCKVIDMKAAMKTVYYVLTQRFGFMPGRIINKWERYIVYMVEMCFCDSLQSRDDRLDVNLYLSIAYRKNKKGDSYLNRYTLHQIFHTIPPERRIFILNWFWERYCYEKRQVRKDKEGRIIATEKRPISYFLQLVEELKDGDLWRYSKYEEEYAKLIHSMLIDGDYVDLIGIILGENDLPKKIDRLEQYYREHLELVRESDGKDMNAPSNLLLEDQQMLALLYRERPILSAAKKEALFSWISQSELWREEIKQRRLPCLENRMLLALYIYEHEETSFRELSLVLFEAVDVLRFAFHLSDPTYSEEYFKKTSRLRLSNQQRMLICKLLNRSETLFEDVWKYKTQFRVLMRCLHVKEDRFPRLSQAFLYLYNGENKDENGNLIITPGRFLEIATARLKEGSMDELLELAEKHPVEFKNNFLYFLQIVLDKEDDRKQLLGLFGTYGAVLKPAEIFKVFRAASFRSENHSHIQFNGKDYVQVEREYVAFDKEVLKELEEACKRAAVSYFNGREPLGKVFVADELNRILFPRKITNDLFFGKKYTFGSRIAVKEDIDKCRISLRWKGKYDVDIHAEFYNASFFRVGNCGFEQMQFGLLNGSVLASHSGDVVPDTSTSGCEEYIELDLFQLRQSEVAYVTVTVNVMDRSSLWSVDDISLQIHEVGDGADRSILTKTDLKSEKQFVTPFVFVISENEIVWVEQALDWHERGVTQSILQLRDAIDCPNATMYQILHAYAAANGVLVNNLTEADTIFTDDETLVTDANKRVIPITNWSLLLEKYVE